MSSSCRCNRYIFFWTIVAYLLIYIISNELNSIPKSLNGKTKNAIIALGTATTLGAVKIYMDGPVFNEKVNLSGKDVVITGGNTGLGKESAVTLASLGAHVTILSRPSKKSDDAVQEIKKRSKNENVDFIPLDLSDLRSVRECSNQIKSKLSKVDVLMNNAGVMAIPERELTKDGFEKQMGINHLGHFLLTNELMGMLKKSKNGRVINVSSTAHLFSKLQKDDFLLEKPDAYKPWIAYGNSKLANILFTQKLASKLQQSNSNSNVMTFSCHPGACRTELGRYIFDPASVPPFLAPLVAIPLLPAVYLTKSAYQGSQTQTFLAASQKLTLAESGKYFDNSKVTTPGVPAVPGQPINFSDADWLWTASEKLTGKPFVV